MIIFIIWIVLVESKCYVLDLAQSTKTWETFPELPQPCAYPAMVYNEKVNRLYVVSCENTRKDQDPWVSSLKASSISLLYEVLNDIDDCKSAKLEICYFCLGGNICVRFFWFWIRRWLMAGCI